MSPFATHSPFFFPFTSPVFFQSVPPLISVSLLFVFFFFFFFLLFTAAPVAYGGSQPSDRVGAVAAGLHHRHNNARSLTQGGRPGT